MVFDRYTMTTVVALAISTLCAATSICKNTDTKTEDVTTTCGQPTTYVIKNLLASHTLWLRQNPCEGEFAEGETVHSIQREENYAGGFDTTRSGDTVEIVAGMITWFTDREVTEEEKRKLKDRIQQSEKKRHPDESDDYTTCICTRTTKLTKGDAKKAGMLPAFQDLPDGTIDKTVTTQTDCTTKMPYKTYKEMISTLRASK